VERGGGGWLAGEAGSERGGRAPRSVVFVEVRRSFYLDLLGFFWLPTTASYCSRSFSGGQHL